VDNSPEALSVIRENLERTRLKEHAQTVRADYLEYLDRCRDSFRLIFLDPPYREIFLETALKRISEIDILKSGGIIVCERPAEKVLPEAYSVFRRVRDYRYGKTGITVYRAEAS
jgi:16S rRNA G966 N2-methylase RsmD